MVAHAFNHSIEEAEAGGWSQVGGQPELQSKTLWRKENKQLKPQELRKSE